MAICIYFQGDWKGTDTPPFFYFSTYFHPAYSNVSCFSEGATFVELWKFQNVTQRGRWGGILSHPIYTFKIMYHTINFQLFPTFWRGCPPPHPPLVKFWNCHYWIKVALVTKIHCLSRMKICAKIKKLEREL